MYKKNSLLLGKYIVHEKNCHQPLFGPLSKKKKPLFGHYFWLTSIITKEKEICN